jgi:DNA repair ATPase RecN
MYKIATTIEQLHSKTLKPYGDNEERLGNAYILAKKYGKKAEILEARKEWQESLKIFLAVDEALSNFRHNLEISENDR